MPTMRYMRAPTLPQIIPAIAMVSLFRSSVLTVIVAAPLGAGARQVSPDDSDPLQSSFFNPAYHQRQARGASAPRPDRLTKSRRRFPRLRPPPSSRRQLAMPNLQDAAQIVGTRADRLGNILERIAERDEQPGVLQQQSLGVTPSLLRLWHSSLRRQPSG